MACKVVSKVNARLRFLHQGNVYHQIHIPDFVTPTPSIILVMLALHGVLISWIKCHIISKVFEAIVFPLKKTQYQCMNSIAFKYVYNSCSHYFNKIFIKAPESSLSLRSSYPRLKQLFCNTSTDTSTDQKVLSFIVPVLESKISE